ncbi:hypothetical protein TWF281_003147 [Arthrobotrys megalospora]
MLPSIIYTVLLASALTVSAAPVGPVDLPVDVTGKSAGDVLSGNKFEKIDIATLNTGKPAGVDIKPVTDAVPAKPNVEGAVPKDGKPVENAEGALPTDNKALENLHLVKQSVTDGKAATFKPAEGTPFDFDILGGICCYNIEEVLLSGNLDICEVANCEMEVVTLSEGKKTDAITLVSDPKSGIMVPKDADVKNVKLPGAPQPDGTPASILGGGKVDEVVVIAKDLGKKEKRQDGFDPVLAYYTEYAYGVVFGFIDPVDLGFPFRI